MNLQKNFAANDDTFGEVVINIFKGKYFIFSRLFESVENWIKQETFFSQHSENNTTHSEFDYSVFSSADEWWWYSQFSKSTNILRTSLSICSTRCQMVTTGVARCEINGFGSQKEYMYRVFDDGDSRWVSVWVQCDLILLDVLTFQYDIG